jgi:hypothetical protein
MKGNITRREFIRTGLAATAGASLSRHAFGDAPAGTPAKAVAHLVAKADAMIHIWLPGGIAQTDTWDPKKYTPFQAGMKGSELLGTCSLVIESEKMYGFHGHFSSGNCLLFFGGGFKKGFVLGKTAERHPMLPLENPVRLEDVHATVYKALGIAADTSYITEGRPFYVTKDGKGAPVDALLA